MITFDTAALLKSLQDAHTDAKRRLEQMVRGFAYEFSLRAIYRTPLGDSKVYWSYYEARQYLPYYLPDVEGIARGNWQFNLQDDFNLQLIATRESGTEAANAIKSSSQTYYLGATFYIGNNAPYISDLQHNRSAWTQGRGILQPTLDDIEGAYAVDFQHHYNK